MNPSLKKASPVGQDSAPAIQFLQDRIAYLEQVLERRGKTELLYLSAVHQAAASFIQPQDLEALFEAIIQHAGSLLDTDHGYLQLLNSEGDKLIVRIGMGIFKDYLGDVTIRGRGISGKVWETGEAQIVDEYDRWEGRGNSLREGICRTICAVPLKTEQKLIGVLALAYDFQTARRFSSEDIGVLRGFTDIASIALDNARLQEIAQHHQEEHQRNITDLKWAQDELSTTYALLMAAIRQNPAGILVAEAPDGNLRIANPAAHAIRGADDEELLNIPFANHPKAWQFHTPDGRLFKPENMPLARAVRKGEIVKDLEAVIKRNNGENRWVSCNAAPVRNQEGEVAAAVMVFWDITERKAADQRLRESEEKFRALFEESRDAIYVSGIDDRFHEINQSAVELLGYDEDKLLMMPVSSVYADPADRRKFQESIEMNGYVRDYPLKLVRKNGDIIEGLDTAVVRRDADGRTIGYQGIIRDITEKKRAEQALRESEEKFRTLAEQALLGIIIFKQGRMVFVNDACAAITGYNRADMLEWDREGFLNILHPDERVSARERLLALELGVVDQSECDCRIITRPGDNRWVTFYSKAVQFEGGRAIEMAMLDISTRVAAENELKLRYGFEQMLTAISTHFLNLAPEDLESGIKDALAEIGGFLQVKRCFVMLISGDRKYISRAYEWCGEGVQPGFTDLNGQSLLELPWIADNILNQKSIISKELAGADDEIREELQRLFISPDSALTLLPLEAGGKVFGALGFDASSEQNKWLLESTAFLRILGQIFAGALERERVSTALRTSEAQFRQAQKMEAIGQLAGGVAHDFNNLLTVISGQSELLMLGLPAESGVMRNVLEIQRATDRAATLVKQLLAYSRKQALEPRVVNLNTVIADTRQMLLTMLGENIELRWHPGADLKQVRVDPGQFQQILFNMAVNSRDAMPNGGLIDIESRNVTIDDSFIQQYDYVQPGSYVLVTVRDNGEGMSEEVRVRVFDPFFTTKEPGKGTGLGLSMAYGIIKQSNGYIHVFSEPGKGTIFHIYLPVADQDVELSVKREFAEEYAGGHERILVVEDEDAVREMAVSVLALVGYQMYEARTGEEALGLCKKLHKSVDLVLTDVVMPRMSGIELADELRNLWPQVRIVFMSGYATDMSIQEHIQRTGDHFIQKPFRLGFLAKRVRELLDTKPA